MTQFLTKVLSDKLKVPTSFNFVNGVRCSPNEGTSFAIINPARGSQIAECHTTPIADVDVAVDYAKNAFDEWQRTDRAKVLRKTAYLIRKNLEDLAYWETLDNGKPVYESRMDIEGCAAVFDYYASVAQTMQGDYHHLPDMDRDVYVNRIPLGVVAGVGAWNYPFQTCSWKVAPALAAGNTFIYKPSPLTPMTAVLLAEILTKAGAPKGVIGIVQGEAGTGQALCVNADVAKVSFTGSVQTGATIQRACGGSTVKPVTLELGGKSPLLICDDADIDMAVSGAMAANFYTQGEVCSNGTRVFVHRSIHDAFVERLVECTKQMRIGCPYNEATTVGATVSEDHMEKVLGYVKIAKDEGAKIVYGGDRITVSEDHCKEGYFLSPCIAVGVTDDMTIAKEEIFGSLLSVLIYDDEDEVIKRANDTQFGLAAGVFTNNLPRAHRIASRLHAGNVFINTFNDVAPSVPFGGVKQSGYGRENGLAAMSHYTQTKATWVNTSDELENPFINKVVDELPKPVDSNFA